MRDDACRCYGCDVARKAAPLKLYLAAPFADRPKMEQIANRLTAIGFKIVARWVYGGEAGLTRQQIAVLDLDDVDAADVVVSFTLPQGTLSTGGGRHVEFGYALAKGKRCIVIGARENVFHHAPGVEVYATLEDWWMGASTVPAELERV
jgi:nucleoside 2-deoxyribosyltransferase